MEKTTIIYQIGEKDNKNKLENIFKELQVIYQLKDDNFVIYIPDVVIAKPVKREIYPRLEEFEQNFDNSSIDNNDSYEDNNNNVRVCSLCSMCITK